MFSSHMAQMTRLFLHSSQNRDRMYHMTAIDTQYNYYSV